MKEKAPNCYECKHRGSVTGSAHSSCKHPSFENVNDDPFMNIMATFASVRRTPPIQGESDNGIKVEGNPYGIKSGWFNHPFNFDPVWLAECNSFEQKKA